MKQAVNISSYKKREITKSLRASFNEALENNEFMKLVNKIKVSEEELLNNTSKLENTTNELTNCKKCKSLSKCNNTVRGCVNFPVNNEGHLIFSYIPCKYKKKENNLPKTFFFETPIFLRNAKLSEVFLDDKKRTDVIKYLKDFITSYDDNRIKGLYLYGSFGSGKSYLLSALINEMACKNKSCAIVYFPSMLRILREGFNDNSYDVRYNEIMKCDLLLIDDIGAEANTLFSRDEILGSILQYRMDNNLSTFFTSNLSLEELEIHLKTTSSSTDAVKARRIIERIKQLTLPMELVAENRRK
ncbi:MAG: primosomal protein DnaI [Bacilli bacterium]